MQPKVWRVRSVRASRAPADREGATRPVTAIRVEKRRSFVSRPFGGLPSECDVIALRELVPAATAPLKLADDDRTVTLCSLLPGAAPALVRDNGESLARPAGAAQLRRPLARPGAVLAKALDTAEPGAVGLTEPPGAGPRLQELVSGDRLDITVHDGFGYWVSDVDRTPDAGGSASSRPMAPPCRRRGWPAWRRRTGPTPAPRSTCAG